MSKNEIRRFAHYRIRALLYAGKPNWTLLAGLTPRWNPKRPLSGRSGPVRPGQVPALGDKTPGGSSPPQVDG